MQNVFGSIHSVGVGTDLSCPYQRNCKKICCVVRWFHSAIMVRGDEEAGAINRSPTPHGVHVGGIAQHKQTVRRWTQTHSLTPIQQDVFIKNVFSNEHSAKHILCEMCLRAYIPPYVVYTKCV